jgi:hypothetical protein
MMGILGGIVYSPIINPMASAMLIHVCPAPQYSGSFQDLISNTFAGRVYPVSSVLRSLISGAIMLILTVASFSTRLPSMLTKTGKSCCVANSKILLFNRHL